ncbi:MAG: phosphatidylglycerophosphatase A [Synergistales bacterium]|nr:phosphatidylglycerophosphatase A [Synergistales bacterium]
MNDHRTTRPQTAIAIATLFGIGRRSSMPGTLAAGIGFLAALLFPFPVLYGLLPLVVVTVVVLARAVPSMTEEERKAIVADRMTGVWTTLVMLPASLVLPAFFLYRIVDIIRPFPVSAVQRLPGAAGMVGDDIVSGILTNLLLRFFHWLFLAHGLRAILGG